jgi:hypothetical protein
MMDTIRKAQKVRVKLYSKRYSLGQDIFTGGELKKKDLKQWELLEIKKAIYTSSRRKL